MAGGLHDGGHAWQGACVVGGACVGEVHVWGMCGGKGVCVCRRDSH